MMIWADLIAEEAEITLPWTGGRAVHAQGRSWKIEGPLPPEHGWHRFRFGGGRWASWKGEGDPDPEFERDRATVRGYLVGDRLIPDGAAVRPDVHQVFAQSEKVWLAEAGLDRFARVLAARGRDERLIYVRQEFPLGPEGDVLAAWQDEKPSVSDIPGVPPALELAFLWLTWQRELAEERRRIADEARRLAEEAARREEQRREVQRLARENAGNGANRRFLAQHDFRAAAKAALAVSGAALLDHRPGHRKGETVVQFRFQRQRFECVVETHSLRILDSGICLVDHSTGERGDTRFTLESLPAVIHEALETGRLVIFRHV